MSDDLIAFGLVCMALGSLSALWACHIIHKQNCKEKAIKESFNQEEHF